jgi:hypothetical protein
VHGSRFEEANGAAHEPLNPGPQIDVFALDSLHVLFADGVLLGGDMPLAFIAMSTICCLTAGDCPA